MIGCVTGWAKVCGGVISCPWNCLFPGQKLPALKEEKKQNDQDITLENVPDVRVEVAQAQHGSNLNILSQTEVVMLVKCWVKCLVRYLPRNTISLTQMMTCVIMRCMCGPAQNRD